MAQSVHDCNKHGIIKPLFAVNLHDPIQMCVYKTYCSVESKTVINMKVEINVTCMGYCLLNETQLCKIIFSFSSLSVSPI